MVHGSKEGIEGYLMERQIDDSMAGVGQQVRSIVKLADYLALRIELLAVEEGAGAASRSATLT